jgi:nitrate reductase gamma subunit
MVTGVNVLFATLMYIDVAKEIEKQKATWHEKGKEIENEFKKLYKPPQPAPKLKKKQKTKQLQKEENKELSSYAAALTKEFLIKVSLQSHLSISCLFSKFALFYLDPQC